VGQGSAELDQGKSLAGVDAVLKSFDEMQQRNG